MTDQEEEVILKPMECHKCGVELEQEGISSFGKCPECGRKLLYQEWAKLKDVIQ